MAEATCLTSSNEWAGSGFIYNCVLSACPFLWTGGEKLSVSCYDMFGRCFANKVIHIHSDLDYALQVCLDDEPEAPAMLKRYFPV